MHSGDWFLRTRPWGPRCWCSPGVRSSRTNPDGGSAPPPDYCNSIQEALSDSRCNLPLNATPGGGLSMDQYLNPPIVDGGSITPDLDWYRVELPAGLTARDLIWIHGGYAAWPQTAVNFTLSVRTAPVQVPDGGTSTEGLGRVVDQHGQGAPQDVGMLFRFPTAQAEQLVVEAWDQMLVPTRPNFDITHPYHLVAARVLDSDVNEPNDTAPAPIALAPSGGLLQGTATGTLAVNEDVDQFSFDVPAPTGPRKIAYVHLTAPASPPPNPPIPYRLMFTLLDPTGRPISQNIASAGSESMGTNLATARLAIAGTWKLIVQGYRSNGQTTPVLGDPDQPYTVAIEVLDEQDANEPNDTQAAATPIAMTAPGAPAQQVTGRLDHIPDPDWYEVRIPTLNSPTLLHYKLRPTQTGGRFAPLVPLGDRELWIVTQVTGPATQQERVTACQTDPGYCPQGWRQNDYFQGQVMQMCQDHESALVPAVAPRRVAGADRPQELRGRAPGPGARVADLVLAENAGRPQQLGRRPRLRARGPLGVGRRRGGPHLQRRPRAAAGGDDGRGPEPGGQRVPGAVLRGQQARRDDSHGHGRVTDIDRLLAGDFVAGRTTTTGLSATWIAGSSTSRRRTSRRARWIAPGSSSGTWAGRTAARSTISRCRSPSATAIGSTAGAAPRCPPGNMAAR